MACSLGCDFDSFLRCKLHLLAFLILFVSAARLPVLLGRQDRVGTMHRRIRALFPGNQGTFRSLHGTYCLLSRRLNTGVVLLLIVRVLRDIIGGTIQELAPSLVEDAAAISIAILHSFRCLTRLCIFELFEILFSVLGSLDHLLIEIIVFLIIIRLLRLAILHRALHVFLFFLIVICFFHDCRLFLLFSQILLRRRWQLCGTCSQARNLPGLGII